MKASKDKAEKSSARESRASQSAPVGAVQQLQSILGNRSLQDLLGARLLQAKLTVSRPDDPYELEAERVAGDVMRMGEPRLAATVPIQRRCCVADDDLRRKVPEEEKQWLSRRSEATDTPDVAPGIEGAVVSLPGRGQPLPEGVRAFMEPRFNADFRAVRIHTDATAHNLARTVNAQAFTVGSNIVFGAGHFVPETEGGKHLLAHELAHVMQQGAADRISRNGTDDPLMRVDISCTNAKNLSFSVEFAFGKSSVVFPVQLEDRSFIKAGDYRLKSIELSEDSIVGYLAGFNTGFQLTPGAADKAKLQDLIRAQQYLATHEPVPLHIWDASASAGGNAGASAGDGDSGAGSKFIAAEAWLDKELLPAVMQVLREKHPQQVPDKLIGYQSLPIQKQEGPDVSMVQVEKQREGGRKAVGHVRVHRGKWVDQEAGSRSQYAEEVANQVLAAVEAAQTQQRWQSPAGTTTHGGRAYDFPPLPARLDGLALQPIGGSGIYVMALDYSAAAPDLLGQVSWAAQYVGCRWELWDISSAPDVKEVVKRVKRGEKDVGPRREVGKMEGAKRDLERAGEDLSQRPDQIERDETEAMAEGRYADAIANELNRKLLPLEVVTRYGKELLGAAADAFGDDRERTIPWPSAGVFLVRCIAALNPNAGPGEPARAPSVATMVVTTRSLESISKEAIDVTAEQAAQLEVQVAILERSGNADPDVLAEAKEQRALMRLEATGSPVDILKRRLEIVTAKRDAARARSILLRAGLHDPEVSALDSQFSQLTDQLKLAEDRAKELGRTDAPARRVRASLVSRITGQVYPLLLQIGEPRLHGGTWACTLSDVTSRDAMPYTGEWSDENSPAPEASKQERAVWEAVERFAGDANYGEGSLTVRLPAEGWFASLAPQNRTRTIESRTKDWAAAKARLEELGTLLVALGLILSSPVAGVAGGLLAAGVAAERLLKRVEGGTFRWDEQAVGDILNILGAVALGAKAIGALKYVPRAKGGFLLKVAGAVGTVGEVTETASDVGGVILCELATANSLMEIGELERTGQITATEARRRRATTVADAIQSNTLIIGSHLGSREMFRNEPARGKEAPTKETTLPKDEAAARELKAEGAGTNLNAPSSSATEREARLPKVAEPDAPTPRNDEVKRIHDAVEHLPEAAVIMDANPTSLNDASQIYYNSALETPLREVAMYRNSETGVYIVIQGTESTVFVEEHGASGGAEAPASAGQPQRWKELLDGKDVGHWDLVAHVHPRDKGKARVRFPDRFPSGWSGDFGVLVDESARVGGQSRSSRIDFWTGDAWAQTFLGYDPAATTEKFWIDYPDQFNKRQRIAFEDLAGYHRWYGETFGVDLGSLEGAPSAGTERPPLAPGAKASPAPSGTAASPTAPRQPLMDGSGHLTDAGIAFVREQFKTVTEGKKGAKSTRETALADLPDERIRQEFGRQWRWLEAVALEEVKGQWREHGETATEFLMANPQQNLHQVFKRLVQAAEAEGKSRRTYEIFLNLDVYAFVKQLVAGNDPVLKPAWDRVEQFSKDGRFPQMRRECLDFLSMAESEPFLLGKIGDKRPDIVELMLKDNRATVFDATFAVASPIHNFKTAFYVAVMQRLISGIQVEGGDYRSVFRQAPVGPP